MAQKSVLQLSVHEERIRQKAWGTVSQFSGVTSIAMDKTGKMTVVGEVDVARVVRKLRKICNADIVSVEVVKPPEKKPEPAKPAAPKPAEVIAVPVQWHPNQYQYQYTSAYADSHYQYPYAMSKVVVEEPNPGCVIM
ncbi:unnamed protein product [Thlaspi arvense]|uniref:HMA domain-containing protein n=1 Tax=Thlaspi arvense TaxID=13288 RepID=A0AAU9SU69_THLAR|nr:unnamed protein product [Thlaspi arvense]